MALPVTEKYNKATQWQNTILLIKLSRYKSWLHNQNLTKLIDHTKKGSSNTRVVRM